MEMPVLLAGRLHYCNSCTPWSCLTNHTTAISPSLQWQMHLRFGGIGLVAFGSDPVVAARHLDRDPTGRGRALANFNAAAHALRTGILAGNHTQAIGRAAGEIVDRLYSDVWLDH